MSNQNNKDNMETVAMRVCIVSIFGNTILSLIKLLAGVIAHSGAMVSDAVHSASDVFSSIIVIVGVKLSAQASDKEHPYGHERLECIAALLLANILCLTSIGIGYGAVKNIIAGDYAHLQTPGLLAAAAAILSIISKEAMFQYTKYHAKRVDSGALMADAWHHRSDAFSSVGALIGIVGARLGFPVLDSIASVVICLFIVKAAYDIFMDATDKMVDHACDDALENELRECACREEGVLHVDIMRTRVFGNKIYVDIEISADGRKTLFEAHEIAEHVHDAIERNFPKVKHVMVHVNPHLLSE